MRNTDKTILVCDDEPLIIEIIQYITDKSNYRIITADNGRDALLVAREQRPDLIVLDVNMPEMTGYEVCEELKSNEDTKDIIIVILTANVQVKDYEKSKQIGADEFIGKPFEIDILRDKLKKLLN